MKKTDYDKHFKLIADRCAELQSKAAAWDMICQLCPHNKDGIANCLISGQDDFCQLMRDMRTNAERKADKVERGTKLAQDLENGRQKPKNLFSGNNVPLVRLIFPILLRKDGKPRKRQPPAILTLNAKTLVIKRGFVVEVPEWVQILCQHSGRADYECFISMNGCPDRRTEGQRI